MMWQTLQLHRQREEGAVGKLSRVTLFSFMWTMMTVVVLNYGTEMRYKDQKTFISAVKLDNLTLRV